MKKTDRLTHIKQEIQKKGRVSVPDLSSALEVTQETIRRDLVELEQDNVLRRVHGGAVSLRHKTEPSFPERFESQVQEKEYIAQQAIKFITPGMRLFIDCGSTTLALAGKLPTVDDITIYTNSPLLADIASADNPTHKTYILGGRYMPLQRECLGEITIELISRTFVDMTIVGVAAIDMKHAFMDTNLEEAEVARAMLKNGRCRMILSDETKFHHCGAVQIASFHEIDYLISSGKKDEQLKTICRQSGTIYL
ncbi:DeoR/GlpR family DNA-binding transcription regulator [Desulfobacter vibrioformis]|uniref:DeoR/GlpR family DNA-binding transcription regulator n=1 Tax=Desulfobacter vibrioformis TaxID=34031 RepID=UPI0006905A0D|nr:DeoR/GlpR family DNA-binding transcription regulator [Desulfobacter vibrioformis]